MKAIKESVTIVMSPDERDDLRKDLSRLHGFLETYFSDKEVENDGSPDCMLMDTMGRIESLCRVIDSATYA